MTFATLTARVNSAVSRHLLTDVGVLDHVEVTGGFSNGPADPLTMAAQDPTYVLPSSACTRTAYGSKLRIPHLGNDGLFTVQAIEPDGTGLTLLRLQKARAK
jgi:hypothetical protein